MVVLFMVIENKSCAIVNKLIYNDGGCWPGELTVQEWK